MTNVLFTSSGRRGYLLTYFREALQRNGGGEIHAANSTDMAVSFAHADHHVVVPGIHDPGYVDTLLAYCAQHRITLVVPLFDVDLAILATARERFQANGVRVVVAPEEGVAICNDKWTMVQRLRAEGIDVPWSCIHRAELTGALADGHLRFPLLMKPRWGMGSMGIVKCHEADDLPVLVRGLEREINGSYLRFESNQDRDAAIIYQELVDGVEYGLDVINDLDGRHLLTNVKQKLAMRSGETDIARTVHHPGLEELGRRLAALVKHPGNLDVDVLERDGVLHVIDMNVRFGGGYPFSHLAGCRLPDAILRWHHGRDVDTDELRVRTGVTGMKDITINERSW